MIHLHYRQIPSARYIPVSRDEVIVKGSAVEGFSLFIEDDEHRGVIAQLIKLLERGGSPESLHKSLNDSSISLDYLAQTLADMATAGAIVSDETTEPNPGAWLAFVRYGHVPDLSGAEPLTFVGGESAQRLASAMNSFGLRTNFLATTDEVPLVDFAMTDETAHTEPGTLTVFKGSTASLVYVLDPASRAEMYRFNERAVACRVPFMAISVSGVDITVGPHVVPGRTACLWEWERMWSRSTDSEKEYELLLASVQGQSLAPPATTMNALVTTATPWLLELAIRGTSSLSGQVVKARATTSEVSTHAVMRLPRCPVCLPLAPALRNLLY